jgi:hypothetical protein
MNDDWTVTLEQACALYRELQTLERVTGKIVQLEAPDSWLHTLVPALTDRSRLLRCVLGKQDPAVMSMVLEVAHLLPAKAPRAHPALEPDRPGDHVIVH